MSNFELVVHELLSIDPKAYSSFENKMKLVFGIQNALNNSHLGGSLAMHCQGLQLPLDRLEKGDIDLIATSLDDRSLNYVIELLTVRLGFYAHEAEESNTADFRVALKHELSGLKIEIAQAEIGLEFMPEFMRYNERFLYVNNLAAILLVKKRYSSFEKHPNFKHSEDLDMAKHIFNTLDRQIYHSNKVYAKLYLANYLGAFEKRIYTPKDLPTLSINEPFK